MPVRDQVLRRSATMLSDTVDVGCNELDVGGNKLDVSGDGVNVGGDVDLDDDSKLTHFTLTWCDGMSFYRLCLSPRL
jgi:hypothetical protein